MHFFTELCIAVFWKENTYRERRLKRRFNIGNITFVFLEVTIKDFNPDDVLVSIPFYTGPVARP